MASENMYETVDPPPRPTAAGGISLDTGSDEAGSFPVWVGSLASSVDESDLTASFQQFGQMVSSKLMLDLRTNVSRNFGYVNFVYEKDAFRAALQMDGVQIKGEAIKTKDPNIVKLMKRNREPKGESKKDIRLYCRDEQKRGGCGRGDTCKYLHIAVDGPPDGQMYGGNQAMMGGGRYDMYAGNQGMMGGRDNFMPPRATEYCRDDQKPRGCGRGDSCNFLHVAVDGPPSQAMQGGMSINDGFNQGFNPMDMPPTQYNNPMNDRYGMMEPPMKRPAAMGAMAEEKYKEQRDELRTKVVDLRDMNEKLTDVNTQLLDRLDERLKILATYQPLLSSAPTEQMQRKDRDFDLFDDNDPKQQEITNDSSAMRDYGHGYGTQHGI